MRSPTIKDVATRAQVSLKTVSRVINRQPSVHASTRQRVIQAIRELNYRPERPLPGVGRPPHRAIGLVYDNPNPYYVISVQNGALSVCHERGFGLQIQPCVADAPDLADRLCALVSSAQLAGLILTPPMSERADIANRLGHENLPFVRIMSATEAPDDAYPYVFVDDRDAAYDITEHMIQLGHQRIGFIWGRKVHCSSMERFRGYADALRDYGIALEQDLIVEGDFSFEDGFRGARRLLALEDRPTAIFGCNDEIAAGVLAAARSSGMGVPYDLSIAGFEDSPFSRQSWPALTTARQATEDIAHHAAQLLIAELDLREGIGTGPAPARGFSPELVVRGSTAPPRDLG